MISSSDPQWNDENHFDSYEEIGPQIQPPADALLERGWIKSDDELVSSHSESVTEHKCTNEFSIHNQPDQPANPKTIEMDSLLAVQSTELADEELGEVYPQLSSEVGVCIETAEANVNQKTEFCETKFDDIELVSAPVILTLSENEGDNTDSLSTGAYQQKTKEVDHDWDRNNGEPISQIENEEHNKECVSRNAADYDNKLEVSVPTNGNNHACISPGGILRRKSKTAQLKELQCLPSIDKKRVIIENIIQGRKKEEIEEDEAFKRPVPPPVPKSMTPPLILLQSDPWQPEDESKHSPVDSNKTSPTISLSYPSIMQPKDNQQRQGESSSTYTKPAIFKRTKHMLHSSFSLDLDHNPPHNLPQKPAIPPRQFTKTGISTGDREEWPSQIIKDDMLVDYSSTHSKPPILECTKHSTMPHPGFDFSPNPPPIPPRKSVIPKTKTQSINIMAGVITAGDAGDTEDELNISSQADMPPPPPMSTHPGILEKEAALKVDKEASNGSSDLIRAEVQEDFMFLDITESPNSEIQPRNDETKIKEENVNNTSCIVNTTNSNSQETSMTSIPDSGGELIASNSTAETLALAPSTNTSKTGLEPEQSPSSQPQTQISVFNMRPHSILFAGAVGNSEPEWDNNNKLIVSGPTNVESVVKCGPMNTKRTGTIKKKRSFIRRK